MGEENKGRVRYVTLSGIGVPEAHHVFVVHDATLEWWRLVATFSSRDRAEQYADVENMGLDDGEMPARDDEKPAPALPQAPRSAITRERIQHPSPQEKVNVGLQLISEAADAAEQQVALTVQPRKNSVATPALKRKTKVPDGELRDNAKALWHALAALIDEGIEPMSGNMSERSGVPKGSLAYVLGVLATKGYIINDDSGITLLKLPPKEGVSDAPVASVPAVPMGYVLPDGEWSLAEDEILVLWVDRMAANGGVSFGKVAREVGGHDANQCYQRFTELKNRKAIEGIRVRISSRNGATV
ncbi:MAG TPA: SANT/Myb-like DNA-binding domain-containing protein [Candidatus Cybelea sp.]|nr:SANT/Myb-like DNA-binding domain-containing protein [Candidatus Cybelea sp.]